MSERCVRLGLTGGIGSGSGDPSWNDDDDGSGGGGHRGGSRRWPSSVRSPPSLYPVRPEDFASAVDELGGPREATVDGVLSLMGLSADYADHVLHLLKLENGGALIISMFSRCYRSFQYFRVCISRCRD